MQYFMVCHVKMAFGTSIIWFFLSQFSQSTLYGRNGSNACKFIALLLAKFYFLHKSALSSSKYMSLLLNWINLYSELTKGLTLQSVLAKHLVKGPRNISRTGIARSYRLHYLHTFFANVVLFFLNLWLLIHNNKLAHRKKNN